MMFYNGRFRSDSRAPATPEGNDDTVVESDDAGGYADPVAEADSESITNPVGVVCRDCPDGDPNGWVAFDLTSSLTNGHVYATHCPFLDAVN